MSKIIFEDIKRICKDVYHALDPVELRIGRVVKEDPIEIDVDPRAEYLTEAFLIIPEYLTKHTVRMQMPQQQAPQPEPEPEPDPDPDPDPEQGEVMALAEEGGEGEKEDENMQDILVDNSLKEGDRVLMFKVLDGQQFLILDRVGVMSGNIT